jgi:hypothetical protein
VTAYRHGFRCGFASVVSCVIPRVTSLNIIENVIISKPKIFTETRTQDSFRVCDLSSCNLLAETILLSRMLGSHVGKYDVGCCDVAPCGLVDVTDVSEELLPHSSP